MSMRMWIASLGFGVLALTGLIAANPLTGSAQQEATPAVQTQSVENDAKGEAVVGTPLLQPAIDLIKAQEIALTDQTGAAVTEVGLDGEEGVLVYTIELDNGIEVTLDDTTGEVITTEQGAANQNDGGEEGENENGGENDGAEGEEDEEAED